MATVVEQYYEKLADLMFSGTGNIQVADNFQGQVKQIDKLLKNDKTGMISSIVEYMIHAGTIDINFDTNNLKLSNSLENWKNNVNKNLNIDIPRGLRSFTEQYFRERWRSSVIIIKIRWSRVNGFVVPSRMWIMDSAKLIIKNKSGNLNQNDYYLNKVSDSTKIVAKSNESIFIRKPYSSWYDTNPTPYLVKKGALYHGLFKQQVLARQAEIVNTAFPYQALIKVGTQDAIKRNAGPTEQQLKDILKQFKDRKTDFDTQEFAKGLIGAFPGDVNFEELIPDYLRALDAKIMVGTDKNILSGMGMIELKGFSSDREEAILNPKLLIEEVEDGVKDYTAFIRELMLEFKERNLGKYSVNEQVVVQPGIISTFLTDDMKVLIRSWFDRGLVGDKSALENTTGLTFDTQVKERRNEKKLGLDKVMYPRVIQNMEKDATDLTDNETVPDDKKKGTPEADNYKNAYEEDSAILKKLSKLSDIPEEIRAKLNNEQQKIFKKAFNEAFASCTKLQMDNYLREKNSMQFAIKKLKESDIK